MGQRRAVALLVTILLTGLGIAVGTTSASAAPQRKLGHEVRPAQPYKGNPDAADWVGSYVVNGAQVWCVQFAFLAPDSDEQYKPGEPLKTKWGTELAPDVAANISYLLLRNANTKSADVAAALGHLLHSWTAGPQNAGQLAPTNDFRHIAYDINYHLNKLPAGARKAVADLKADAAAKHGPWTTALTAPTTPQIIGAQDDWTVTVTGATGKGLDNVPVKVTVTDGKLDNGKTSDTINTAADGTLKIPVTPTGAKPSVKVELASPADRPVVRQAIQLDTQRIVSTGGEKTLTKTTATTARTAPGAIKVTKINDTTGKAIAGVPLRLTGKDRTSPAIDQDGKPIVGTDGKPTVLITGSDGVASVPNLKTPQEICLTEVAPPAGFDERFDPNAPPFVCGVVEAGATLALSVNNKPNVPIMVPAGGQPLSVGYGQVVSERPPWAWLTFGAVLLLCSVFGGLAVRRRITGRR